MTKTNLIIASLFVLSCLNVQAGLLYNYSELATKDLDQISKLVNDKLKESKKSSSGKVIPLREALQAVYSRPNTDDMIEKVAGPIRTQLDDLEAWEKTITLLTDEAIGALKHPQTFKPLVQGTYVIFLHNLLADLKPMVKNDGFEKKIVEKVRDAKIAITKSAQDDLNLRIMKEIVSPSEIAQQILKSVADAHVKEQKSVNPKTDSDVQE